MRPELAELVSGDVNAALDKVAAVAAAARTKQARTGLQHQLTRQLGATASGAGIGAGLGAGGSLLYDMLLRKKKERLGVARSLLEGGLAGGAVGGSLGAIGGSLAEAPRLEIRASVKGATPGWADWAGGLASGAKDRVVDYAGKAWQDPAGMVGRPVADAAKGVWNDPTGRSALIGGGLGMLGGGLYSLTDKKRRKRWLSNALTTGLLGGAVGGGFGLAGGPKLMGMIPPPGSTPEIPKTDPETLAARAEAGEKAQQGYETLGRLGHSPMAKVKEIQEQVASGKITVDEGTAQIQKLRPQGVMGGITQLFRSVPDTLGLLGKGKPEEALMQADVPGLKGLTDPRLAGTAIGGYLGGRTLSSTGYDGNRGLTRRLLGNVVDWAAKPAAPPPVPGSPPLPRAPFRQTLGTLNRAIWDIPGTLARQHQDRLLTNELAARNRAEKGKRPDIANLNKAFGVPDPLPGHVSPTAAATRAHQLEAARKFRGQRQSGLAKGTGGGAASLMALAPLLYREWGPGGYRSGAPAARDVAEGSAVMGGK